MHQQQRDVIDYRQEENRIVRAAPAPRRLHLTDDQRRRLANKGARRISGPPSARSWLTIMKNGRTKGWTTSASRPRPRRRD
jgi:hypothetical protein